MHGIARRTKNIALRFHLHRGVDIADDHVVGMQLLKSAHLIHGAALYQAAAGFCVWNHHDPLWIQYLSSLRHKPHTAKGYYVPRKLLRLARQFQTIPNGVRQVLNFGILIVMRQNDRAPFLLERGNVFGD